MKKIRKIIKVLERSIIRKLIFINDSLFMKHYLKYLNSIGVNIHGEPKFISPDVYIDGKDFSLITIGDNTTISREVMLLTHDYSVTNAVSAKGKYIRRDEEELYTLKPIEIGNNVFIGARSSILPGTIIGDNTIIGACTVVKGHIPEGVIFVGNPGKIIGNVYDYADKVISSGKYRKG